MLLFVAELVISAASAAVASASASASTAASADVFLPLASLLDSHRS